QRQAARPQIRAGLARSLPRLRRIHPHRPRLLPRRWPGRAVRPYLPRPADGRFHADQRAESTVGPLKSSANHRPAPAALTVVLGRQCRSFGRQFFLSWAMCPSLSRFATTSKWHGRNSARKLLAGLAFAAARSTDIASAPRKVIGVEPQV